MKRTTSTRIKRKTLAPPRPRATNNALSTSVNTNINVRPYGSADSSTHSVSQRKASTPTHDKTTKTESPDVSLIEAPSTSNSNRPATTGRPTSRPLLKTGSEDEISLKDKLDFEYTRYLQTMFRRKLAEAHAAEADENLTALQKKIAENQNILQKTTERLKNINFNKEVETLHSLRNRGYGRVLETLEHSNCTQHLEMINKKLEQSQNQLKMKNVELPQGGGAELLKVINETVAACENLRANNNVEVPKLLSEIKATNNNTSEILSRCLELVPEVEDLMISKTTLEIFAKDENNELSIE